MRGVLRGEGPGATVRSVGPEPFWEDLLVVEDENTSKPSTTHTAIERQRGDERAGSSVDPRRSPAYCRTTIGLASDVPHVTVDLPTYVPPASQMGPRDGRSAGCASGLQLPKGRDCPGPAAVGLVVPVGET